MVRVAIFADIIKFVTVFIKTIFKTQKIFKKLETVSKCSLYHFFLI